MSKFVECGKAPCLQILQEKASTGQVPRVMYTVPTGHNPTGQPAPALSLSSLQALDEQSLVTAVHCRDCHPLEQEAGDIQHLPGVQHYCCRR